MWTCPKCEREFQTEGKDHFCIPHSNIDEYIAEQDEHIRPILCKVRETIRRELPDATEKISWRMPTYWQGENLIHFAAFKNHFGIYPGDHSLAPWVDKLDKYKHTKGAIQFPYPGDFDPDSPEIDYDFIAEIADWCLKRAQEKGKA